MKKGTTYWASLEKKILGAIRSKDFPPSHRAIVITLIRLLYEEHRLSAPITNSTICQETGLSRRSVSYALINLRLKGVIKMRRRRVNPRWDKPHFIALNSDVKTWKPSACAVQWLKLQKCRHFRRKTPVGVQGLIAPETTPPVGVQALHRRSTYSTPKVRDTKFSRNLSGNDSFPKNEKETPGDPSPQETASTPSNPGKEKKVPREGTAHEGGRPQHKPFQDKNIALKKDNSNCLDQNYFLENCLRADPALRDRLRKMLRDHPEKK